MIGKKSQKKIADVWTVKPRSCLIVSIWFSLRFLHAWWHFDKFLPLYPIIPLFQIYCLPLVSLKPLVELSSVSYFSPNEMEELTTLPSGFPNKEPSRVSVIHYILSICPRQSPSGLVEHQTNPNSPWRSVPFLIIDKICVYCTSSIRKTRILKWN